jgi:hypothetical protein
MGLRADSHFGRPTPLQNQASLSGALSIVLTE